MPKSMNIKKAASALNQNHKQIKAALNGTHVTFAAVEKSLGRAQFLLKLTNYKSAKGAPRGLFSAGTMRISAGHIVIVEGSEKLGYEIVARLDNLADAQKLVKIGVMPADVLASAATCGSASGVKPEEEDNLFERPQETEGIFEPSLKGGVKGARKQQESMAAASALAERLGSGVGGGRTVRVEEVADLSYLDPEVEKKAKANKTPMPAAMPAAMAAAMPAAMAAAMAVPAAVPVLASISEVSEMAGVWEASPSDEESDYAPKPIKMAKVPECWEDIDIDAI
jgi:translation initiation factor IF-1